jgi:tetratricopeptide (TPR) repeat protein
MPSHTYFWIGRYRAAEDANLAAVKIDDQNAARLKPKDGVFGLPYHAHNVQYGEAATLMDGDAKQGLVLAAAQLQQLSSPHADSFLHQFGLATAYFVFGRFASLQTVDSLPQPDKTLPYALAMWHYARGEAAARNGDAQGVQREADKIAIGHDDLAKFGDSAAQAQAMVDIARLVLEGRVAMMEKRWSDAEADYRKAADTQDAKLDVFNDPPTWWYPVRRSIAAALLAEGNPMAAEVEVNAALARWPLDPQSLRILADCQQAMGHSEEAKRQSALALANWRGDAAALPMTQL